MNKYQKEKSREIRDIMRTNPWRRMSYKEAKRKWKKGYRTLPMIVTIRERATARGITFSHTYLPGYDAHEMRFTKKLGAGGEFEYYQSMTNDQVRLYRRCQMDIADDLMQELDMQMRMLGIILQPRINMSRIRFHSPAWGRLIWGGNA